MIGVGVELSLYSRCRILEIFFVKLHIGNNSEQNEINIIRDVFIVIIVKVVVINIVLKKRRMKRYRDGVI